MDDNCVFGIPFIIIFTSSMSPETAATCTCGHFSQVVFAVLA